MSMPRDKLNRPLRDLRISLTDQCNFRCAYCMPKEIFGPEYAFLKGEQILTNDEIVLLASIFAELGIEKIRLTGGEPLLRKGLPELVAGISDETKIEDISLTTNGVLLPRYAEQLRDAGLRRINVSLDSLHEDSFTRMNGNRGTPKAVLRGIDAAIDAGLRVKVNMVVQRGINDHEVLPMAEYFKKRGITLRYIEYMDVGNSNDWKLDEVFTADEILERIESKYPIHVLDANYKGEVASRFGYNNSGAEFGIIRSVTNPFCQDCNRSRLSADGKIYTCLFAKEGFDIKTPMRKGESREDLKNLISNIWIQRSDRYSEERESLKARGLKSEKVEMSYIGG